MTSGKDLAVGALTGGKVKSGKIADSNAISEVYVGIGPLVVKCSRGEQKAQSGDTIVSLTVEHEDREDEEIIFILPVEATDAVELLNSTEDLSSAEYEAILNRKAQRAARHFAELSATSSGSLPTAVSRTRTDSISVGGSVTKSKTS